MATMTAAVLTRVGELSVRDTPRPRPCDHEVLVKVARTGVCGSDLSTYAGTHPYKTAPTILGHEYSGTVTAVGSAADGFAPGDRVCSAAYANCSDCEYCAIGKHHLCVNKTAYSARGWDGSFAEFVVAKPVKLYKLDAAVSFEAGALVEPLSIALHALRLADVARKSVAIIGSGSIGLATAICARRLGASHVLAIDCLAQKRDMALACGADQFLEAGATPEARFDVTVVAASYDMAIDDAVAWTRSGGKVIVVSYFGNRIRCAFDKIVQREIELCGSALSEDDDSTTVLRWLAESSIDPVPMITHRLCLSRAAEAMEMLTDVGSVTGKIMLSVTEPS